MHFKIIHTFWVSIHKYLQIFLNVSDLSTHFLAINLHIKVEQLIEILTFSSGLPIKNAIVLMQLSAFLFSGS